LAVKYLDVFPREDMDQIVRGRVADLPILAAFRQPLWSATTLAILLGVLFMGASVALSFDGIRRRVPAVELRAEDGEVSITDGIAELKLPGDLAIKMGETRPGLVIFSHARHVDAESPTCIACHSGKFKMLPSNIDISPMKKMEYCGQCHDGVKAVGIRDKERCNSCHANK